MRIKLYLKEWIVFTSPREYIKRYWYFSFIRLYIKGATLCEKPKPWKYIDIAIVTDNSKEF